MHPTFSKPRHFVEPRALCNRDGVVLLVCQEVCVGRGATNQPLVLVFAEVNCFSYETNSWFTPSLVVTKPMVGFLLHSGRQAWPVFWNNACSERNACCKEPRARRFLISCSASASFVQGAEFLVHRDLGVGERLQGTAWAHIKIALGCCVLTLQCKGSPTG